MDKVQFLKNDSTQAQAVRYLFVGGLCTVIDMGLLYLLTEHLGVHYILSGALSFSAGVTANYFMCTKWVFTESKIKNRGVEFLFYIFVSIVGLGLNLGILWILTSLIECYFMLSKMVAIAITLIWNFCSRKYLLH